MSGHIHTSHSISLNSTESLPIPPRSSSRQAYTGDLAANGASAADTPSKRIVPTSQLSRHWSSSSNSPPPSPTGSSTPKLARHDTDNRSGSSANSAASPTPSSPGSGRSQRKPVPAYLPMPNTELPADHPFSSSHLRSPSIGRAQQSGQASPAVSTGGSGSEAGTPGWREDKDLFFGSGPGPGAGAHNAHIGTGLPPPPRKNARRNIVPAVAAGRTPPSAYPGTINGPRQANGQVAQDNAASDNDVLRRGTFDGLNGLNIYLPGTGADTSSGQITTHSTTTAGYETAPSAPSSGVTTPVHASEEAVRLSATPSSASTSTPKVERPLPALPDDASVTSLGLQSILGADPSSTMANGHVGESYSRSNSSDSRAVPTTPRTMQYAPTSPAVHGLGGDGDASSIGSKSGRNGPLSGAKAAADAGTLDEEEEFSVSRPPSKRKLWEAGTHFVRDEEGRLVYFGDLFPKWDQDNTKAPKGHTKAEAASLGSTASLHSSHSESAATQTTSPDPSKPPPRTVLFFIRHFWCGQCQDYMFASICLLDPEAIRKANIRIAIISTGSYKFIKKYRKLTKCPFPIYVDGGEKLYNLLGMIEGFNKFGPWFKGRAAYNQSAVPFQIMNSFKRAPKLFAGASPGNFNRMGGEFILEPGFECSFAHRMTNFSNHMEAPDVVRLAGCDTPTKDEALHTRMAAEEQVELEKLQSEMNTWRQDREVELDRIRRKKAERRGKLYRPISKTSRVNLGLDEPLAAGERRESDASVFTNATELAMQPIAGLDISIDEAASTHTDEVEELEEEQLGNQGEKELDEEFHRAMRMDEEAREKYDMGRRDTITA